MRCVIPLAAMPLSVGNGPGIKLGFALAVLCQRSVKSRYGTPEGQKLYPLNSKILT